MMRKTGFQLIIIVALGLVACGHKPEHPEKERIKTMVSKNGYSVSYTYTPDGKIATSVDSRGIKTTYKYESNRIIQDVGDTLGHSFAAASIFLSPKGLTDSSVLIDENGVHLKTYTHDENGYSGINTDYNMGKITRVTSYIYKDGNEAERVISASPSEKLFSVYFDYYKDDINTQAFENYGLQFMGKESKNLMKKYIQVLTKGDTVQTVNFNYHFDNKGRVIQKAMYDTKSGVLRDSTTFTYY
jgi:hypothetical protein